MKIRKPYVAGQFYEDKHDALIRQIEGCFKHKLGAGGLPRRDASGTRKIAALVSPHAGYMYSGPTASRGFHALAEDGRPSAFVVIGPNHSGMGSGVSLMAEGQWDTPLGSVTIDSELADSICKHAKIIDVEEQAHLREHSIEVQLPFLQYVYGDVRFVPICMLMQDLKTSLEVADGVAEALKGKDAVVIASSDMTHYRPHEYASRMDRKAIDAILRFDEKELNELGESNEVTMCGYGPITVAVRYAELRKVSGAELLGYSTSGDITEDRGAVVGYASVAFSK